MGDILDRLNDKQKEAVTCTEGAVLVLAGAGSGKTTVLVNRIAYILSNTDTRPWEILAITFTNKAANEMKERIALMMGDVINDMWVSTFHSMCVRILRSHIDRLGFDKSFVIYDSSDNLIAMKECYKQINQDDKEIPQKSALAEISTAKNNLIDPATFEQINEGDYRMSKIAQLYKLYQRKLKANNALDFDDIIFYTVKLLSENPDVLEKYQRKFKYILVDEYQDTNNAQYMLVYLLAAGWGNLCVVGDDDQSIYKFRGANVQNILDFKGSFPDAYEVKLEENYRSTGNILTAANNVISNNNGRHSKKLWTQNPKGENITLYNASNDRDEGDFIARTIQQGVKSGKADYSSYAVLYRTNAQSRSLEEALIRQGISYRVFGGMRFFERKEIKDMLAYMRLIHNLNDNVSLARIINEPKRGIGTATLAKAQEIAAQRDESVFSVISNAEQFSELKRSGPKLKKFVDLINELREDAEILTLGDLAVSVMEGSGYVDMLTAEDTVESRTRMENLKEFISLTADHEKQNDEASLSTFLESVALVADVDSYDEEESSVALMTIHSAKGLEFPIVFIAGLEEGLFPSTRGIDDDIEEERRLCYVAVTRAKEKLYITHASERWRYGKTEYPRPSRFLNEMFPELRQKEQERQQSRRLPWETSDKDQNNDDVKPQKYSAGEYVMHPKFGRGQVISAKQFGNDCMLTIDFESVGQKQLMAIFAKLRKCD